MNQKTTEFLQKLKKNNNSFVKMQWLAGFRGINAGLAHSTDKGPYKILTCNPQILLFS